MSVEKQKLKGNKYTYLLLLGVFRRMHDTSFCLKTKFFNWGSNWTVRSTTHPQYVLRSSQDPPESLRHNAEQRVAAEATENLANWWVGASRVRGHGVHSDPIHFVHTYCHLTCICKAKYKKGVKVWKQSARLKKTKKKQHKVLICEILALPSLADDQTPKLCPDLKVWQHLFCLLDFLIAGHGDLFITENTLVHAWRSKSQW